MSYICTDRGSDKCPCILMEAGQCYTCGMIRTGKCDCPSDWQGVCPYTEYKQRQSKAIEGAKARRFLVRERKDFSPTLTVVTLEVPFGYALACSRMGTFVMVESGDWNVPLSVFQSAAGGKAGDNHISLAISVTGPKTINLLKQCSVGTLWNVKGPYYNGLLNSERYNPKALSIVVGKGIALMPFLNQKKYMGGSLANFYLDKSKLPGEFIKEYVSELEYEETDLQEDMDSLVCKIKQDSDYCLTCTGIKPNLLIMTSPYFAEQLRKKTTDFQCNVIYPNHSNMCCGEGLCGACSYTDEDGVTVRRCKCND